MTTSLKSILISLFCVDDLHEQITGSTDPSSSVINTNKNNSTNTTSLQLVGGVIGGIITALILVSVVMITAGCICMKKRASM